MPVRLLSKRSVLMRGMEGTYMFLVRNEGNYLQDERRMLKSVMSVHPFADLSYLKCFFYRIGNRIYFRISGSFQ